MKIISLCFVEILQNPSKAKTQITTFFSPAPRPHIQIQLFQRAEKNIGNYFKGTKKSDIPILEIQHSCEIKAKISLEERELPISLKINKS